MRYSRTPPLPLGVREVAAAAASSSATQGAAKAAACGSGRRRYDRMRAVHAVMHCRVRGCGSLAQRAAARFGVAVVTAGIPLSLIRTPSARRRRTSLGACGVKRRRCPTPSGRELPRYRHPSAGRILTGAELSTCVISVYAHMRNYENQPGLPAARKIRPCPSRTF
jgi:hypothetical protein